MKWECFPSGEDTALTTVRERHRVTKRPSATRDNLLSGRSIDLRGHGNDTLAFVIVRRIVPGNSDATFPLRRAKLTQSLSTSVVNRTPSSKLSFRIEGELCGGTLSSRRKSRALDPNHHDGAANGSDKFRDSLDSTPHKLIHPNTETLVTPFDRFHLQEREGVPKRRHRTTRQNKVAQPPSGEI